MDFYSLTLVTNKGSKPLKPYLSFVEKCLKGGVTCVQLREKTLTQRELFLFATELKSLLDHYEIPLIINDHVDLCLKLDAFGIHLGQSDDAVSHARKVLGDQKIIGLSVNTIEQLKQASDLPINYLGVGAIFPTRNKPDVETIWGIEGLKEGSSLTNYPIVAIGGIEENNALSVIKAGATGLAAIGAFHEASDPFLVTKQLVNLIQEGKND